MNPSTARLPKAVVIQRSHTLNQRPYRALRPTRQLIGRIKASNEGGDAQPPPSSDGEASAESAPLEGSESVQLPQSVITRLRDTVFGFDTLFVTRVENYEQNGVLFKGNLRGDPQIAYDKMKTRLQAELGDTYQLFLLEDREELPVAVVIPKEALTSPVASGTELGLAILFGLTTVLTTLNINDAQLFNAALLVTKFDPALVAAAVPGTLAFLLTLAAHEVGHYLAAKKTNVELGPPLFLPAGLGLIGSFGAITRFKSMIPDRDTLAEVTVAGPLYGSAVSAALLIIGFGLTAAGVGGIDVDSSSFQESFLVGGLGQLLFGNRLFESAALSCNPLLVAGWSGLIVNAINCLPAGELDGGRLSLGLWGRRSAANISTITLFLLGLVGITNALALFWLLLVLTVQRGPILPCAQEISEIKDKNLKVLSIAMLLLPLIVLLPYPFGPGSGELPVDF